MSFRKYLVLVVVTLFAALGDLCLKRGMSAVGEIHVSHLLDSVRALSNPWVFLGVIFLLVFFAAYLHALSWADLTFVLPAAAMSYVVLALLSVAWLHENVSLRRWVGIILITSAVGFVTRGGGAVSTTSEPDREPVLAGAAASTGDD